MKLHQYYKKVIRPLFCIWVALHTFNYSVDIDAVLVSQANYSTNQTFVQGDKIESFGEIIYRIFSEDDFSDMADNPFSQNESKSVSPTICLSFPKFQIVAEQVSDFALAERLPSFYLDKKYPTPIKDIIPPPPRIS